MRQDTLSRRRADARWRALIHTLNQRYRAEFDRAEQLAAELRDIHASRAWRVLAWLRRFRKRLLAHSTTPRAAAFSPGVGTGTHGGAEPRRSLTGRVSIVIPFRDQAALLRQCLQSLRRSSYLRYEVVLVDNGSSEPETHQLLERLERRHRFQIVPADEPFNFARLCNRGARQARGDYLLFLNNDIEVLTPDWLEQMLAVAARPSVGVVGATLLYTDRSIQHAGLSEGPGGWAHIRRGARLEDAAELRHVRQVPAVTGACLLMDRQLFEELGGFDERFAVTHNDVDLCRRVRDRGLTVAITPHARLLHYESLSRGYTRETVP
jgi:GT2 family glycosyltransferase